jgi:NAD(P)-dependent dehydrogenase (short-subunit alcohol dehydrogenase family)
MAETPFALRSLTGQRALVTGAGSGIGAAIAVGLAEHGMAVALCGRRPDRLASVAAECREHDVPVLALTVDVGRPEAVRDAVAATDRALGPIDLLVNNAGVVDPDDTPLWSTDPDLWWTVFETNVRGTFNMCRSVLPAMVARRSGRVVNINTIFAVRHDVRYSAYSTSKAAVLALSDTIAGPLADHGVSIFDISPGMVETALTRGMRICDGRRDWTDVRRIVHTVVRLAHGELDPLRGMFLHAGADDLTELLARSAQLRSDGARTVRLRPHGAGDPIA